MTEQLALPLDMEITPDAELTPEAAPRTRRDWMADPRGSSCSCRPPDVRDLGDR